LKDDKGFTLDKEVQNICEKKFNVKTKRNAFICHPYTVRMQVDKAAWQE
jgi:hypothetical protein